MHTHTLGPPPVQNRFVRDGEFPSQGAVRHTGPDMAFKWYGWDNLDELISSVRVGFS